MEWKHSKLNITWSLKSSWFPQIELILCSELMLVLWWFGDHLSKVNFHVKYIFLFGNHSPLPSLLFRFLFFFLSPSLSSFLSNLWLLFTFIYLCWFIHFEFVVNMAHLSSLVIYFFPYIFIYIFPLLSFTTFPSFFFSFSFCLLYFSIPLVSFCSACFLHFSPILLFLDPFLF